MANFLYVDNSNVWIEGMHVAAVANGLAASLEVALDRRICDKSWRIDFGRLFEFAGGEDDKVGRAVLYGSKPPPNDSLWAAAARQGFDPVIHERNAYSGQEKKVDTNIVTDIMSDALELMDADEDVITLVAGDSDYVPTVEHLVSRDFIFDVCFWDHASGELKSSCSQFISLNPYLEYLQRDMPD